MSASEHDAGGAPRIAFDIAERVLAGAEPVLLLELSGELDYAVGPRLGERLSALVATGSRRVLVDLTRVTFIDSMAIGVLVGAATRIGESGGALAVLCAGANERVLRIFDIAGVAALIPFHRTRAEGLASLSGREAEPADGTGPLDPPPTATRSTPAVARRYARSEASARAERQAPRPRGVDELA